MAFPTHLSFLLLVCSFLLVGVSSCFHSAYRISRNASKFNQLDKIAIHDHDFVDKQGRRRLFHGINAVLKYPPWYPEWLLNDTKLQYLNDWGFNVVRLGVMWSGVQPVCNFTNQTYLNKLQEIVSKLQSHGIYVILDMHQDVISSYYGTYDGMPRWLVDKLPASPHAFPWPLPRLTQWADGYLTQAAGRTFQQLYDNVNGARRYFEEFWRTVANSFNSYDSVLGYEIINEPWCGDIYSNPEYLLPGIAGRTNLQPLYGAINDVIREVDNVSIVFYEPVTWGVVFNGSVSGTGFTEVPGGSLYANRSALSFHYYCWLLAPQSKQPYPALTRALCDSVLGPKVFEAISSDIRRTGGGSFLTEFGLCKPDGNENSTETIECEFVLQQADQHVHSWTYWDSAFFLGNGSIDTIAVRPFARPFARSVHGRVKKIKFDVQTSKFTFVYLPDNSDTIHTEIFVPRLHYPNGFTISKSPGLHTSFDKKTRILSVTYNGNSSVVGIILSPKSKLQ